MIFLIFSQDLFCLYSIIPEVNRIDFFIIYRQFFNILFVIENAGGTLAQKNIEKILDVSHPTVTGLIARLQEKGFVECGADPDDRRNKIVTMTQKAYSLAQLLRDNRRKAEEALLAGLSEEETEQLGQTLIRLYTNLEERKV